jgi:DNA gyrase subunit A
VLDIIKEDLYELKERYADGRRTQIVGAVEEVTVEDLIREEDMAVTVSHAGYIKRQPMSSYRAQRRGGMGVRGMATKEEDFIEHLFIASTHDYLLFLTDRGRLHWLKVYDIPQFGRAAKGRAIVNILQLERREKVTSMVPVRTFDPDRYLVMATRKGTVKKTSLDQFSYVRRTGINAIKLNEGDHLVGVELTDGANELLLATRNGQAIRFDETDVRPMGRTAAGVRGATLAGDDKIVALVKPTPGTRVLTICQNGYGKQTDVEAYRKVRRGAKGVININTSDRNGPVVACMAVREGDQIMVMTVGGQVVRIRVDEVRETGRAAQGVRIVSFKAGQDAVASVALIAREGDEDDADGGDGPGEPEDVGADESPAESEVPADGGADLQDNAPVPGSAPDSDDAPPESSGERGDPPAPS